MMSAPAALPDANLMFASTLFACGAVVSAALTAFARRYALRRQLLDHPGQRRSHTLPTPRGGGIGPVVVMLIGGGLLAAFDPQSRQSLAICLSGLVAVAGIGWLDDHRPLPTLPRFAVHLGAALAASVALLGMPQTTTQIVAVAASTLVVAGLINAWNFMDGINGIAASQAGLVTLILLFGGWLAGAWWSLALLLLAAMTGFLPFNVPRARIFLGDVGSGALGFLVACLLLRTVATGALSWPVAALPVSAFLVDSGMTLLLRIMRGKTWWQPHREHLYQWLVRSGCTHVHVGAWYALWTLLAGALAMAVSRCSPAVGAWISSGAILFGCLLWMWLRTRLWMIARHRRRHDRR